MAILHYVSYASDLNSRNIRKTASLDSLFRYLRALPREAREVPVDHVLVREAPEGTAVGLAELHVAGAVDRSLRRVGAPLEELVDVEQHWHDYQLGDYNLL